MDAWTDADLAYELQRQTWPGVSTWAGSLRAHRARLRVLC